MSTKQILFFAALAFIYLFVDYLTIGTHLSLFLLKPAIVTSLALFFWKQYSGNPKVKITVLAALCFSVAGDATLMFEGTTPFLVGLSFFLVSHVLYILTFVQMGAFGGKLRALAFLLHIFLIFAGLNFLWPDLGDFAIPVSIYTIIIVGVRLTIRHLPLGYDRNTYVLLGYGSLLFIISDFIIAIGKFKTETIEIAYHHQLVMITYILAQFFLIQGILQTDSSYSETDT